jgi:hypothetical protein
MDYTKLKVSSGLEVEIRPRTYGEWESHEDARLEAIDSVPGLVAEGKRPEAEKVLQRTYRQVRSARLASWVKDFAGLKNKLTLRDIGEIEKAAEALEVAEIEMGNSGAGGSGQ